MLRYEYVFGLDLAESEDFTALAVLRVIHRPKPEYHVVSLERFNARNAATLDRIAEPSSDYWGRAITFLVARFGSPTVRTKACAGIDATGIGRRVLDLILRSPAIRSTGTPIYPFQIRARETRRYQKQDGLLQVSRAELLSGARLLMEQRRLLIASALPEAATLRQELLTVREDERRQPGDDGPVRQRKHDDCVFAIALATDLAETLANRPIGGILPVRYL